jgi:hypothetical protein
MTYRVWVIATAVAFGLATWLFGWWSVPVIALVVGASRRVRPLAVAIAAVAAWSILLVIDSTGPGMSALGRALSGLMGVPITVLILLTWIFPAALGWSLATVGETVADATRRR